MNKLWDHLTIILPVFNESHRIDVALRNFHGRAPIVVIDNFSEDETVTIARKYTDRIVQRRNRGFSSPADYEFMFSLARTEWILIIYAGHYFPTKLLKEIEQAVLSGNYDAVVLSGVAIQYGDKTNVYGWNFRRKPHNTRLFKKSAIDLTRSRIHSELPYHGPPGRVYYPPNTSEFYIQNYRDDDIMMMSRKTLIYSEEEARQKRSKGEVVGSLKVSLSFFWHLSKRLFWRLAILEGASGIIIAIAESYRFFFTDARLWELSKEKTQQHMMQNNVAARETLLRKHEL